MKSLVYGVGVNDANYVVRPSINGRQVVCFYYRTWQHMLERCYSEKYQLKRPTYVGCSVCEDWHYFLLFRSWMQKQNWQGNHLDKDIILAGNRTYSPSTCAFVSIEVNNLLNRNEKTRGSLPIGVTKSKGGRYISLLRVNNDLKYLGTFTNQIDASVMYLMEKYKNIILQSALCGDINISNGLIRHAEIITSKLREIKMTDLPRELQEQFDKIFGSKK